MPFSRFFLYLTLALFLILPLASAQAGLIPCGLSTPDPTIDGGGTAICTLCHLLVGIWNIIQFLRNLILAVALTVIVAMAFIYITSAGDEGRMRFAKGGIVASLIGFAIVLLAWVMVNFILTLPIFSNSGLIRTSWDSFSCSNTSLAASNLPATGSGIFTPPSGTPGATTGTSVTLPRSGDPVTAALSAAPSTPTVQATAPGTLTLTWPPVAGSSGYQIERCTGSVCSAFAPLQTVTTASLSDTGLLSGTSYTYRIRTLAGSTLSNWTPGVVGLTSGIASNAGSCTDPDPTRFLLGKTWTNYRTNSDGTPLVTTVRFGSDGTMTLGITCRMSAQNHGLDVTPQVTVPIVGMTASSFQIQAALAQTLTNDQGYFCNVHTAAETAPYTPSGAMGVSLFGLSFTGVCGGSLVSGGGSSGAGVGGGSCTASGIPPGAADPNLDPGMWTGTWSPVPNLLVVDQSGVRGLGDGSTYIPGCVNQGNSSLSSRDACQWVEMADNSKTYSVRYASGATINSGANFHLKSSGGSGIGTPVKMSLSTIPGDFSSALPAACRVTGQTLSNPRISLGANDCPILPNTIYYLNLKVTGTCPPASDPGTACQYLLNAPPTSMKATSGTHPNLQSCSSGTPLTCSAGATGDPGIFTGTWHPAGMPNVYVVDQSGPRGAYGITELPGCVNQLNEYIDPCRNVPWTDTNKIYSVRYASTASISGTSFIRLEHYTGIGIPAPATISLSLRPGDFSVSAVCTATGLAGFFPQIGLGGSNCPILPNSIYYFNVRLNGPPAFPSGSMFKILEPVELATDSPLPLSCTTRVPVTGNIQ